MAANLSVSVEGFEKARLRILSKLGAGFGRALNKHIGERLVERLKDHLDQMSATRHKTADRLGAEHTHHLEFASGRTAGSMGQGTEYRNATNTSVTLAVKNTPSLRRAFGPMTIRPVRARALTIPIHKISYARTVKELKSEGHEIFKVQGRRRAFLAEPNPASRFKIRPLYVLLNKVTIPQDKGLLPTKTDLKNWAAKAVKGFERAQGI